MAYSRENPSPRYQELLGYYATMHATGSAETNLSAESTFDGRSLPMHAATIRSVVQRFGAKTLLDYGAGKAWHYENSDYVLPDGRRFSTLKDLWGLDEIRLYDPGYEPYADLPQGRYDAVICTDVLEHIPEEDLDWVVAEMFGYARQVVYAGIATYPAGKILPNGDNAHVTLKPMPWWVDLFQRVRTASGATADFALIVEKVHADPRPQPYATFR